MNIEWMCLFEAIGKYLLVALIVAAFGAALWGIVKAGEWILKKVFGASDDFMETVGVVMGLLALLCFCVIYPIIFIYQKTCP